MQILTIFKNQGRKVLTIIGRVKIKLARSKILDYNIKETYESITRIISAKRLTCNKEKFFKKRIKKLSSKFICERGLTKPFRIKFQANRHRKAHAEKY